MIILISCDLLEDLNWICNFFKAGGSSGTIAYTQSAYDMKVSDAMYGEASRYVCEERLITMLETEYETLKFRLPKKFKESNRHDLL